MASSLWPRIATDDSLHSRWLPTPPPASPSPNLGALSSSTSSDCDPVMTDAMVDALTSTPEPEN